MKPAPWTPNVQTPWIVAATLLSIIGTPRKALAFDEAEKAKVSQRYSVASEDFKAQRYCKAADGFSSALTTIPLPVLALWAARANVKCGDLIAALDTYSKASQLAANELWTGVTQQRAQVSAADELAALRSRIPHIVIKVTPSGNSQDAVTLDGAAVPLDKFGTEIAVNPGKHTIVYTHEAISTEKRFNLSEHHLRVVQFPEEEPAASTLLPVASPISEVPPPVVAENNELRRDVGQPAQDAPAAPHPPKQRYKVATVLATVAGGVGLTAGLVTRILALHEKSTIDAHCDAAKNCDPAGLDAVSRADSLQTQSTVYFILGAAAVSTGIGLVIAGRGSTKTQARIVPMALPMGAGLSLRQGF